MNKGYIFDNSKFYIGGDNGIKTIEFTDNIDDIIETEDRIEEFEKQVDSLSEQFNTSTKTLLIPAFLNAILQTSAASLTWLYFLLGNSIDVVYAILLMLMTTFSVTSITLSFQTVFKKKRANKEAFEYASNQLDMEKEKLKELISKKSTNNIKQYENDSSIVYEVDNFYKTQSIDEIVNLHYQIGLNPRKYRRYLKNGKLKEIILNIYYESLNDIELEKQIDKEITTIEETLNQKVLSKTK